ncbi:MAG: hypothetical protein NTW07_10345, partial [candidate division Zixibacteria bacterium]|nr:hypothetical protein [candidate division Zixibacteria bacterium]
SCYDRSGSAARTVICFISWDILALTCAMAGLKQTRPTGITRSLADLRQIRLARPGPIAVRETCPSDALICRIKQLMLTEGRPHD